MHFTHFIDTRPLFRKILIDKICVFFCNFYRAAGLNSERPFFERDGATEGGNFNRGERIRGISGSSDGRNRGGPRQNWKDNDDAPYKNNRNNRFDNHRDMRKSSRWGNNSPKSEENWSADNNYPNASSKKSAQRKKSSDNNNATRSSDSVPPAGDAPTNESHETNDDVGNNERPSPVYNESNQVDNTNASKPKSSPSRKTSTTSTNARSGTETNQGNTTPLYDEPAEAPASDKNNEKESFPSNNNQSSSANANDGNVAEIETNSTE